MEEISDELPEHAPRFVLLSYPVTKPDGRKATPYVLIAWVSYVPIDEVGEGWAKGRGGVREWLLMRGRCRLRRGQR